MLFRSPLFKRIWVLASTYSATMKWRFATMICFSTSVKMASFETYQKVNVKLVEPAPPGQEPVTRPGWEMAHEAKTGGWKTQGLR